MKLKFRHKVFLTFFLNSLLIVVCMLVIARYYAFRSFEEYIVKVEMERLDELVEALSLEYRKSLSWDPVVRDWNRWLRVTAFGLRPRPKGSHEGNPPPLPLPLFLGGPGRERNPGMGGPPPFGPPHSPPPGPPPEELDMQPRICLFDAQKSPLTRTESSMIEDYRLKPVLVDGQVIGWLGIRKHERPTHPLDVEFIKHQSETFYSIGGVALILAILVTFVLSRHLLAPVKELAQGARALTSRRFETRIEIRSRDELGQLVADFNTMAQALERYEQIRRQWMADISHELRTPLAILRCEIEAMLDGLKEVSQEGLESLHFEVLHVGRIVHDLHDLSLIESRAFGGEQTAVDPLEVLDETLRAFETRFEQRGIRIEAQRPEMKPVLILADGGRLTQLYSNVLENTLRYALTPGTLKIFYELTSDRLLIHFEDSGPGVPEESLVRLFDRLYRVDKARSCAQGGSGLGLAICKSIVESFGGRIEASNATFGGLRITILFPLLSI